LLLVDDHPILSEGVAQRINGEPDLAVCAQAPNAPAALEAIETYQPDLAIIDISLTGTSGIELLKDIQVRFPKLPVLVLSMHDEKLYAERCLRAGARAYLMKQERPEVLIRAIRQVLRGQIYLSERITTSIVNRIGGQVPKGEISSPVLDLSDRELEIFQWMGEGFGTREIAKRLHLSVKTVASHREHIKQKLNLQTGEELIRFAIHWGRYDNENAGPTKAEAAPIPAANKRKLAARKR
jgi:DNA-binding NarL/FixJ family response regulator